MSIYNITGWSGGGRRPLTYNLQPGQFRNTRVNVFPNQTIINNNIGSFGGCYDYGDCCCGGGNSTPKWMNWMMGIGMGTSLLGGIMNMFGLGGGAKETEGAGEKKTTDNTDLNNLKTLYGSKYNIVKMADGTYVAKPKSGGATIDGKDADELRQKLDELENTPAEPEKPASPTTPAATTTPPPATEEANPFEMLLFDKDKTTFTSATGEEKEFKVLTGQNVFKLDRNFSEITIDKLIDKGGPKDWDIENVKISKDANGDLTCNPEKIGKHQVSAEILGKDSQYIRLKVGDQTYIVAQDKNAYQYENGNVDGYSKANLRKGS